MPPRALGETICFLALPGSWGVRRRPRPCLASLPEATHPLPMLIVLRVVKLGPELPLERSVGGAAPGSPPPLTGLSLWAPRASGTFPRCPGPHRGHWLGVQLPPHAWPLAVTSGAPGPLSVWTELPTACFTVRLPDPGTCLKGHCSTLCPVPLPGPACSRLAEGPRGWVRAP